MLITIIIFIFKFVITILVICKCLSNSDRYIIGNIILERISSYILFQIFILHLSIGRCTFLFSSIYNTNLDFDPRRCIFSKNMFLFVFHVNNIRAWQNTRNLRTEPTAIRKSSTKPEAKLIKYPNDSKFWFLEKQNRIRSEPKYFGYPNVSEINLYTCIY